MQRRLDLAGLSVAVAHAEQAGRDHPGVVEHQGVAGTQQRRQVGDHVVEESARRVHPQQLSPITWRDRSQRNAVFRQVEVEIVEVHPGFAYAIGAGRKTVIPSAMNLIHAAILTMAAGPALLALLGLGGVFSKRLDVLTHFTPLYGVCGLIATGLAWAIGPPNHLALASGLTAVLAAGGLMAPELMARLAQEQGDAEGSTLKLIQFNLWYLNQDPARTARWIEEERPDIVVVEEAVRAAAPVVDALAASLPHRSRHAGKRGRSTLILSRFPMSESGDLAEIDPVHFAGAWARIDDGTGPFVVVGLHLTWPVPPRPHETQSRRTAERLAVFDSSSLIVAGDFNATPWSFALRRQDARFAIPRLTRAMATWPAARTQWGFTIPLAFLPIDHIYAGPAWRLVSLSRGPRLGSDHLPLVAVLARNRR